MTERFHFQFSLSCIGEGNGNPLQRSCLENPREGGALWEVVYRVAQSQTRLKRLSSSKTCLAFKRIYIHFREENTSLVAQMVKRLPTVRETWVQSLGQEDPLEKAMAPYIYMYIK